MLKKSIVFILAMFLIFQPVCTVFAQEDESVIELPEIVTEEDTTEDGIIENPNGIPGMVPIEDIIEDDTEEGNITEEDTTEEDTAEDDSSGGDTTEEIIQDGMPTEEIITEMIPSEIDTEEELSSGNEDNQEEDDSNKLLIPIIAVIVISVIVIIVCLAKGKNDDMLENGGDTEESVFSGPGVSLCIEVLRGDVRVKKNPFVMTGEVAIGSDPTSNIVCNDAGVEATHAKLVMSNNDIYLVDTSIQAGTYIEGMRIQNQNKLRSGDIISVGSVEFIIKF